MNIFAKIITTSEESIKNEIIHILWLEKKENVSNFEMYSKLDTDSNIIFIYFQNNFQEVVKYVKENFEVVKFLNIGTSLSLDTLDINFWDIIVPNTFINKENEVVFLEYLVEKNYDLKNFWLLLNGICLSLENDIVNEEQLNEIMQNYSAEIFDKEWFYIAKTLEENALLETSSIIKIIWKEVEFIKNWVQILEVML